MGSEAVKKGSEFDVSNGPLKNRKCTDVLFLLLFIAGLGVYVWTAVSGIDGGNMERLIAGRDWQGNFCGVTDMVTDADESVAKNEYIYYTLNMQTVLDKYAASLFADSSSSTASIKSDAASSLALGDWVEGDNANAIINSLSTYLNGVCLTECVDADAIADSDKRDYVWKGPTDSDARANWDTYVAAAASDATLMEPFTFKALPVDICPYEAEYCVALPNVPTTSLLGKYCVPQLTVWDAAVGAIDSSASAVPDSWGASLESGFGDMMGDLQKSWPLLLLVSGAALVIGLIFMVVLKHCVGVFIWVIIFGCFAILVACGVTGILYANKCNGEALVDTASRLAENMSVTGTCSTGYSVTDETMRTTVQIFSYVVFGIAAFYLLLTICMCARIRLGIALNKVAASFVGQNKLTLSVPVLQILASVAWIAAWVVIAGLTVSQIPDGTRDMSGSWSTVAEAAKTGNCNEADGVYLASLEEQTGQSPSTLVPTYKCKEQRYLADWRIYYQFFFLLWKLEWINAIGECAISGAVGVWYFSPNTEKGHLGSRPTREGVRNVFRYHLGTMAFGSLILAIVGTIKAVLDYLATQAKASKNKYMAKVYCLISYLVACVERFIRFLNRNAYIQTALLGTNFCRSAKNAFFLVIRNAARVGVLNGVGGLVNMFGKVFITAATTGIGWVLLTTWFDGEIQSPVLPICMFIVIGYIIGGFVMGVYTIAVDAALQCFLYDEEIHAEHGGAKYTPTQLAGFLNDHGSKQ